MEDRQALRLIADKAKLEASTRFVEGSTLADELLDILSECGFSFTEVDGRIRYTEKDIS